VGGRASGHFRRSAALPKKRGGNFDRACGFFATRGVYVRDIAEDLHQKTAVCEGGKFPQRQFAPSKTNSSREIEEGGKRGGEREEEREVGRERRMGREKGGE